MLKHLRSAILVSCLLLLVCGAANSTESAVPEPFKSFDDTSGYSINYDDLTGLLEAVVADVGRSDRKKAATSRGQTGTRLKAKINRYTVNEGNRFFFEAFVDDDAAQRRLSGIQESLAQATSEVPLRKFSRDEQLAYWLNLYNVTVLSEIVKVYPQRNLEKLLYGKNSILAKKLLTVEGVSLSLDDIRFTILKRNYDSNPLIIYGLYQGIIGGPNIRRTAYSGADVYLALRDNAAEFINSNRGTAIKNAKSFRVSSLFERNREFFPDFDADLTAHLLEYLEGDEHEALRVATKVKPDINDWTVTDLGGSRREIGGSFANSGAALMGAVSGVSSSNYGGTASGASNSGSTGRINTAVARQVQDNKEKPTETDEDRDAELAEPGADADSETNQNN